MLSGIKMDTETQILLFELLLRILDNSESAIGPPWRDNTIDKILKAQCTNKIKELRGKLGNETNARK